MSLEEEEKKSKLYKVILLAHKVLLSGGAWGESESRGKGVQERRKEDREHDGMKANCINSIPILLLCCDRLSNMQAHFLCQRLEEGSQERLSLLRALAFSPAL